MKKDFFFKIFVCSKASYYIFCIYDLGSVLFNSQQVIRQVFSLSRSECDKSLLCRVPFHYERQISYHNQYKFVYKFTVKYGYYHDNITRVNGLTSS